MLSIPEKQKIADAVEKAILEINHPELAPGTYDFHVTIQGEASYSKANIDPNWKFK